MDWTCVCGLRNSNGAYTCSGCGKPMPRNQQPAGQGTMPQLGQDNMPQIGQGSMPQLGQPNQPQRPAYPPPGQGYPAQGQGYPQNTEQNRPPYGRPGGTGAYKTPQTLAHTLFLFKGRIPRSAFWLWAVASAVISSGAFGAIFAIATAHHLSDEVFSGMVGEVGGPLILLLSYTGLAVQIKRFHDIDKPGFWVLLNLVPGIGGLACLYFLGIVEGDAGDNEYGANSLASK